jgi:hypothetical protein
MNRYSCRHFRQLPLQKLGNPCDEFHNLHATGNFAQRVVMHLAMFRGDNQREFVHIFFK